MAALQSFALGIILAIQSIFFLPLMKSEHAKPLDYGGDPYVEAVIDEYLPLFEEGETDYAIVLPDTCPKSDETGAAWLQEYIEGMTGFKMRIYKASQSARISDGFPNYIAVGDTGLDNGALDADILELKNEGFIKKVIGDNVYIYGIGRGTMYGCSSFIEEQMDCHWYTPETKVIPEDKNLAIDKNLNDIQNTSLEYRDVYWQVVNYNAEWKAFHKINSGMGSYMNEKYGYGINYMDFCHTMGRLVPESYYAEHKEYFAYRRDTKSYSLDQRCLTNPDVFEITLANVKKAIDSAPLDYQIMSVTQNDNDNPCECDNCLASDAKYEAPSGTNIEFANKIARAVKEAYPNRTIFIDTFAYGYTTHAPKNITPDDNVIVRLCSIGSCFCHPVQDCGHGRSEGIFERMKNKPSTFAEEIVAWDKLCKVNGSKLYIWDYTTNFKSFTMPFPNIHVLSNNIQFYINNSVYGIFEQGNGDGGKNGEFCELRAFILAKMLWNPYENVEHLINEFMNGFYGEASAPYVKEYLDYISQLTIDKYHLHIFNRPEQNTYFNTIDRQKLDKMWDNAEEKATDEVQLKNVQRSRLSLRNYKANMMMDEFSVFSPDRVKENEKLFYDNILLGINRYKEGDVIYTPYYDGYLKWRPIEWGDPSAWLEGVDDSKLVPLDLNKYRLDHGVTPFDFTPNSN